MKFTKKIRGNNQITLPSDIVESYDIRVGDFVELDLIKVTKK